MERINEIMGDVEQRLKQAVKIEAIEKVQGNLNSLGGLINQLTEKMKEISGTTATEDIGFSLEEYVNNITSDMNQINEKFTNFVNLSKKLETDEAIKDFLAQKLEDIYKDIDDEASRTFNLSTFRIFTEMMEELKGTMAKDLIGRIEKELFSIKTELGEFQKIQGVAEDQFSGIQQSIESIQLRYQNQIKSIKSKSDTIGGIIPQIAGLSTNLKQNYEDMQKEIGDKLANVQNSSLQLLNALRAEVRSYEAATISQQTQLKKAKSTLETDLEDASKKVESLDAISKMSAEELLKMKQEHRKMKEELENVSEQLEKVTDEFSVLSKDKEKKIERREVLALLLTLLTEVFGAQPHSKLLFLLHGQKADMSREDLKLASGISGAVVRIALKDLAAAKLVHYDVVTGSVKLLKRIY